MPELTEGDTSKRARTRAFSAWTGSCEEGETGQVYDVHRRNTAASQHSTPHSSPLSSLSYILSRLSNLTPDLIGIAPFSGDRRKQGNILEEKEGEKICARIYTLIG